jgi:predicted dehydrogenase
VSKDLVGVGIVGCGGIANNHAKGVIDSGKGRLAAFCDTLPERTSDYAERYAPDAKQYTDSRELCADPNVDAILVCTPHGSHCRILAEAAEAGVHGMCEKPMSNDLRECDKAIEAHKKAGTKLGVIHQRRYYNASQRLRRAIDEGRLGKPILGDIVVKWWRGPDYYARDSWRGRWDTEGGGVLVNQTPHQLDALGWYMGPVEWVHGMWSANKPYMECEDTAVATVKFRSGGLGMIQVSISQNPNLFARVTIHGDNGKSASIYEHEEGAVFTNDIWTLPGEEDLPQKWAEEDFKTETFQGNHAKQIRDFLEAIKEDREPYVGGEEGRKTVELMVAILLSGRLGETVHFPVEPMSTTMAAIDREATNYA